MGLTSTLSGARRKRIDEDQNLTLRAVCQVSRASVRSLSGVGYRVCLPERERSSGPAQGPITTAALRDTVLPEALDSECLLRMQRLLRLGKAS